MPSNSPINFTLLIDDDKLINFYNTKIVNKHLSFNNVTSVNSGKSALDYLKLAQEGNAIKPDIIFLDLNMPAMNGWEFLEEYKKIDANFIKDIKIVILTTSSNPDDYKKSKFNVHVNDFINKPLTIDILDELLLNQKSEAKLKYSGTK